MSLIPEIPNPYVGAFIIGVLYGTVLCTSTCLPYVASYIAGIGADFRKGVTATLIYNLGRTVAYAMIGGLAGIFSSVFKFVVDESSFSAFQQYSSYGFGVVTIIIGASILWKSRVQPHDCDSECPERLGLKKLDNINRRFDLRAFSLGFSRGLVVCPYLVAILFLYTLPFASAIDSFAVAVLFGLGTTLSPMLLLGGVTGWLLHKAPLFRKWISTVGGLVLVVLGVVTLINTILFPIA